MKKIIIIVVAVLVLAGGGVAAWMFLLNGGAESESTPAEHGGGPVYVDMPPFIIQVIRESGVAKNVSIAIQLEVAGPEAEKQVKEQMVYIRDAFWTRLHATLSRGAVGSTYDAAKLKRQLLAQADDVLGPGVVTQVLIGNTVENTTGP